MKYPEILTEGNNLIKIVTLRKNENKVYKQNYLQKAIRGCKIIHFSCKVKNVSEIYDL